ncbi:MAG: hypothetical protein ACHQIG_00890 [Acidimicrobiia bacterium]
MKREIAERFAALAVEGTTTNQVQRITAEFFKQLALCPGCDGEKVITFGHDVSLDVGAQGRSHSVEHRFIPAGTTGSCPRCGGDGHDPAFVVWHCEKGQRTEDCKYDQHGDASRREGHEGCGWRIMVPLDAP